MSILTTIVGHRIRDVRISKNISQEWLADAIGLSRTSITNAELGAQRLPLETLYSIGEALGVEPTEFLPTLSTLKKVEKLIDI